MEPHTPYAPPEPHRSRWACPEIDRLDSVAINNAAIEMRWKSLSPVEVACLASLYDGEVAAFDAELRTLFAELQEHGFLDDAIVVLTADHGEEFLEHGRLLHGFTLYDEMVHVPLLVIAPGYAAGQVVEENVSLVDVAPTLVEILGLPPVPNFEGRSLVSLMQRAGHSLTPPGTRTDGLEAPTAGGRPVLLELGSPGSPRETREHTRGVVLDAAKLLERPDRVQTVFDLTTDPGEERPNATPSWREWQERLDHVMTSLQSDLQKRAGRATKGEALDDATREKLRALGYHF
jgi:arylsulfatase A-like enzyme